MGWSRASLSHSRRWCGSSRRGLALCSSSKSGHTLGRPRRRRARFHSSHCGWKSPLLGNGGHFSCEHTSANQTVQTAGFANKLFSPVCLRELATAPSVSRQSHRRSFCRRCRRSSGRRHRLRLLPIGPPPPLPLLSSFLDDTSGNAAASQSRTSVSVWHTALPLLKAPMLAFRELSRWLALSERLACRFPSPIPINSCLPVAACRKVKTAPAACLLCLSHNKAIIKAITATKNTG